MEEGPGLGHTGEPQCTPQGDSQHRDSPQQSETIETQAKTKISKPREMGRNMMSRVVKLLDSKVFPTPKKSQDIQRNRKLWPISRKNK